MIENELIIENLIEQQLAEFNITDAAIAELREQYLGLTIMGIDDKKGYLTVKAARLDVKAKRVEVDKKRKQLNENALIFQRAINGRAKEVTEELRKIEDHLGDQESYIDSEHERIAHEAQQAIDAKIKERATALIDLKFNFNGVAYVCPYLPVSYITMVLEETSDEAWVTLTNSLSIEHDKYMQLMREKAEAEHAARLEEEARLKIERDRIAEENSRLQAEKESLAKQKAELEAERASLDAIKSANCTAEIVDQKIKNITIHNPTSSPLEICSHDLPGTQHMVIESEVALTASAIPDLGYTYTASAQVTQELFIKLTFDDFDKLIRGHEAVFRYENENFVARIKLDEYLNHYDMQTLLDAAAGEPHEEV